MSKNKRVLSRIEKELKRRNKQRYSRSISATNQLFTPNYLTSKPSRRRVFDPNADYYKAGGMTDHKSMMGYRDDSEYRNEPYIDIKTRTGEIDMSKTGIPLLANGVYLPPYSGVHQFDTNVVREIPLAKEGMTVAAPKIDRVKGTNINGKIQCPPGYTYNPQTRWCERTVCPSGYTLDKASGKCISTTTRQKFVMPEKEVPVLTDELKTKMTQERYAGFSGNKRKTKKSKISLENLNPKWDARYNTWVQEDPNNPGKMLRFRDSRGSNNSWEPLDDEYKESYDEQYTPEGRRRVRWENTSFITHDEDKGRYVRDKLSHEGLAANWGDRPPLRSVVRGLYKENDYTDGEDYRRGPNLGTTTLRKDYISQHPELKKYLPKDAVEIDYDDYTETPLSESPLTDQTQITFQDNPFFSKMEWQRGWPTADNPLKTRSAFPTVYGFKTKDGKVVELAGGLPMYLQDIPAPKWKPKVDPKRAGEYDKKTKTYYVKDKSDPIYLDWAARTEEAKLVKENKKNMLSYLRETYDDPKLEFITTPGTLHQTTSYNQYDAGNIRHFDRESYQDDESLNTLYKDLTGIGSQEEYIKLLEDDPLYFQKLNPGLSPEEAKQAFAKKYDDYQKQNVSVELETGEVFKDSRCKECRKMHKGFGYKDGALVYSTSDPVSEEGYGVIGAKIEYEKDETDPDIERLRPDYITRDAGAPKKPNPPGFHPFIDFGDRKQWLKKPKLTLPDKKERRAFRRTLWRHLREYPGSGKYGLLGKNTRINWPTAGGSPDMFGIHGTGGRHALDLFDVNWVPAFNSKRLNRGYTRDELARISQANQRALETGEELDFSDIPLGGIRGLRDRIAYKKKYRDYKKQLPQYEEDYAEYEENKRLKDLELAEQQRKDDAFRAGIPYVPSDNVSSDDVTSEQSSKFDDWWGRHVGYSQEVIDEAEKGEYINYTSLPELSRKQERKKKQWLKSERKRIKNLAKEPKSDDNLKAEIQEDISYETGGSIDMDLTPEEVEEYKKQGYILEDLSGPRAVEEVEEDYHAGMNAMMKARLAYEYMHGNPAATRMVAPTDNPYIFPSGAQGTHFMSSYDNYAIPEIQSVNGVLKMTGPRNKEAIRFDRPEDADYFAAENYKRISPAFKKEGGELPKAQIGKSIKNFWNVTKEAAGDIYDYGKESLEEGLNNAAENIEWLYDNSVDYVTGGQGLFPGDQSALKGHLNMKNFLKAAGEYAIDAALPETVEDLNPYKHGSWDSWRDTLYRNAITGTDKAVSSMVRKGADIASASDKLYKKLRDAHNNALYDSQEGWSFGKAFNDAEKRKLKEFSWINSKGNIGTYEVRRKGQIKVDPKYKKDTEESLKIVREQFKKSFGQQGVDRFNEIYEKEGVPAISFRKASQVSDEYILPQKSQPLIPDTIIPKKDYDKYLEPGWKNKKPSEWKIKKGHAVHGKLKDVMDYSMQGKVYRVPSTNVLKKVRHGRASYDAIRNIIFVDEDFKNTPNLLAEAVIAELTHASQARKLGVNKAVQKFIFSPEGTFTDSDAYNQMYGEIEKGVNKLPKNSFTNALRKYVKDHPKQDIYGHDLSIEQIKKLKRQYQEMDHKAYEKATLEYISGKIDHYEGVGLHKHKEGGELPKYQGPGRSIVKGAETVSETIAPKIKNIIPEVKNVINFLSGTSKEFGLLNEAITSSPAILNDISNILQTSNINYKNTAELKSALDNITTQYFNPSENTFSFPKTNVSKDRIKSQATFNISDVDARGKIKGNTDSRGIIKTPLTFKSFTPGGKIFNLATDKKGNVPTEQAFNILKKEKFGDIKFSRLENIIKSNFGGKIPSKINLNTLRNFTESSITPFDLNVVDPTKSTIDASSDFGFEKLNYKNPEESKAVINSEREDEVLLDQIEYLKEQIANFDDLEAQGLFTYSDLRLMEKELDETQALYDMKLEELNIEAPYNMENKTLLFTNKDLKVFASDKHASGTDDVLSHVHYTVRSDSPGTFTVTQFQSDAFQGGVKEWREFQNTAIKQSEEEIEFYNNLKNAKPVPGTTDVTFYVGPRKKGTLTRNKQEEMLKNWEKNKELLDDRITTSKDLLSKEDDYKLYNQTWEPRILQETVDYAARNGQNTFRFPTQETTIKIQGYNDVVAKALTDKSYISKLSEYDKGNYYVTQRYQKSFPKLVEKIYGVKPKIVTDAQGNTWWEFRIPEGVMKGTQKIIAYKKGGSVGQQDLPKHQATGIVKGGKDVIKYGDDIVKGAGNALKNLSKFTKSLKFATTGPGGLVPKLEISDRGYEYLPNRPFFEAYPITKSQKFKVKQQQEAAHQEGVDFVKNWFYEIDPVKGEDYTQNLRIRPEVQRRMNVLIDQERFADHPHQENLIGKYYPHMSNFDFTMSNPLRRTKNLLINTDWENILRNKNLEPRDKWDILETINRWDDARGVNLGKDNSSITFANKGRYYNRPETITDISLHEAGHTGQRLGYQFLNMPTKSWLDMVNKYDEVIDYSKASDHTPIGKRFKDAMVDKEWKGSVGELHSETMVSRKKAYDQLVNQQGVSPKQAMDMLQNPNDDVIRFLMTQPASFGRTLHDFFKPGTTEKTKIDLLKLLPAGGIGIGIGTMNNDSKSKLKKLKEGGEPGPGYGTEAQRKWLIKYIKSPMYLQRLGKEFPDYSQKELEKERDIRLRNVQNVKVKYPSKPLGRDFGWVSGEYYAKQRKESDKMRRGDKWIPTALDESKKGTLALEPEYGPNNWRPASGFDMTPLHEFSHAIDDGGYRIPKKTVDLIHESTVPFGHEAISIPNRSVNQKQFGYLNDPTELTARLNVLRHELEKAGIWKPGEEEFIDGMYNYMIRDENLMNDSNVKDILNAIPGGKFSKQKRAILTKLLNEIAMNNQSPDGLQVAAKGGEHKVGEEVNEATMRRLKKLGYKFEKI